MSDKILTNGVTLVDFWAPWCGPCKAMLPVLDKLKKEITGDFSILKINVDDVESGSYEYSIMMEHNIKSIPHFVIYKDGRPVKTLIGAQQYNSLFSLIKDNISA